MYLWCQAVAQTTLLHYYINHYASDSLLKIKTKFEIEIGTDVIDDIYGNIYHAQGFIKQFNLIQSDFPSDSVYNSVIHELKKLFVWVKTVIINDVNYENNNDLVMNDLPHVINNEILIVQNKMYPIYQCLFEDIIVESSEWNIMFVNEKEFHTNIQFPRCDLTEEDAVLIKINNHIPGISEKMSELSVSVSTMNNDFVWPKPKQQYDEIITNFNLNVYPQDSFTTTCSIPTNSNNGDDDDNNNDNGNNNNNNNDNGNNNNNNNNNNDEDEDKDDNKDENKDNNHVVIPFPESEIDPYNPDLQNAIESTELSASFNVDSAGEVTKDLFNPANSISVDLVNPNIVQDELMNETSVHTDIQDEIHSTTQMIHKLVRNVDNDNENSMDLNTKKQDTDHYGDVTTSYLCDYCGSIEHPSMNCPNRHQN